MCIMICTLIHSLEVTTWALCTNEHGNMQKQYKYYLFKSKRESSVLLIQHGSMKRSFHQGS